MLGSCGNLLFWISQVVYYSSISFLWHVQPQNIKRSLWIYISAPFQMMQNRVCIKLPFKQWQSSRSALPTHEITYLFLTREISQKFRLFPSLGAFRWQCKQKQGHSKTVKGIWKLFYHLQETIGAFVIGLTISILRWFIGFLLDWSASLLAVSFHNRILCLIIYCVTSLSLLLLYCIFVLKLSFRMVTIVSALGSINNDSSSKTNSFLPNHRIIYQFAFLFEKPNL